MARTFNTTNSDALAVTATPAAGVPLTMAAWVKITDVSKAVNVVQIHNAGFTEIFRLRINTTAQVAAQTLAGGVARQGFASATVSAGVWTHVAAVFATTASRTAYKSGANPGSDTNSSTPGAMTITDISAGSDTGNTMQVALPAIWTAALSAGEIAALATGLDPRLLQSQRAALVDFWPLIGASPEPDWIAAARNLTVTGATRSDDPTNLIYGGGRPRPNGNRFVYAA